MRPSELHSDQALMRVYSRGEIPVRYASSILNRLQVAHSCLSILDRFSTGSSEECLAMSTALSHSILSPDETSDFMAASGAPLELNGVVLQSPGWWEFLGSLNPLKAIMDYMNMRHEQAKDNTYRNRLDQERKVIENDILRVELFQKAVEALRTASVPPEDIAAIARDYYVVPLLRLESLQDRQLIERIELVVPMKSGVEETADV